MSRQAMKAFHRLRIRPRMDGTALCVLFYLCVRHSERSGDAWPSIDRMCRDLDLARRTVINATNRLECAGLIRRSKGGGRGISTRYSLRFLQSHLLAPDSDEAIEWRNKQCSPRHCLEGQNSAAQCQKQCSPVSKTVQPTALNNKKTIKQGETPAALDGAGARKQAEIIYGPRERLGPADQAMFDKEVERLTENQA